MNGDLTARFEDGETLFKRDEPELKSGMFYVESFDASGKSVDESVKFIYFFIKSIETFVDDIKTIRNSLKAFVDGIEATPHFLVQDPISPLKLCGALFKYGQLFFE